MYPEISDGEIDFSNLARGMLWTNDVHEIAIGHLQVAPCDTYDMRIPLRLNLLASLAFKK
ncbi:13339_t:CDS:2 [Entrophospora sp. SA101]|nr:15957_t:CDS:2 [Entrophospora sp. SA101]CAJ0927779.1 13339_t:CDS:2 [Entrophospora sp. SA101]